jgi:hypothetical protein
VGQLLHALRNRPCLWSTALHPLSEFHGQPRRPR